MASTPEFVQYVCERLAEAGAITSRKMFGEYGIYCNGKIIGVVCENQLFVKKTEEGARLLTDKQEAQPYTHAKPHFVIDSLDDSRLLVDFVKVTCDALPAPRTPRKFRYDL